MGSRTNKSILTLLVLALCLSGCTAVRSQTPVSPNPTGTLISPTATIDLVTATIKPSPAPNLTRTVVSTITPTARPPLEGHFVVVARGEIYMVDASCAGIESCWVKLTDTPGIEQAFAAEYWLCGEQITASPDGKFIAFAYRESQEDIGSCVGGWDIYTIDVEECLALDNGCDSGKFVRLTDDPADDISPDWSPDGNTIAFISTRGPYQPYGLNGYDLYVMSPNGSDQRRLIGEDVLDYHPNFSNPDWSPDGQSIVFSNDIIPPGDYHPSSVIYSANSDGSNVTQLTTLPQNEKVNKFDWRPQWSPDGSQIVFDSNRESSSDIYVMNIDGSNITRLTSYFYNPISPHWSPDGARIAFLASSPGGEALFIIDRDGQGLRELTYGVNIGGFIWIP